jgi:hypothetical protein
LGISAVCRDLISKGIPVFSEIFCDLSDIDLIAEYEGNLHKMQVKTCSSKNGRAELVLRSCGPNGYNKTYSASLIDIFALYVMDKDLILYVDSHLALQRKTMMSFRFETPKNSQRTSIHWYKDFLLPSFLRDYTCPTLTDNAEGKDIVQATTDM